MSGAALLRFVSGGANGGAADADFRFFAPPPAAEGVRGVEPPMSSACCWRSASSRSSSARSISALGGSERSMPGGDDDCRFQLLGGAVARGVDVVYVG